MERSGMNILLYDMGSYTQDDLIYYLRKAGHKCKNITYRIKNAFEDSFFEYRFEKYIKEDSYDCVVSTNFHPLVAKLCYRNQIKYLSWCYDSPIHRNYMDYYAYPTNYIFLFDRLETEYFISQGIDHFYHLPLAVNTDRLSSLSISSLEKEAYSCDISFIGQFYHSPLKTLLYLQNEYIKGYIQGIVNAQLKIYGCNLVEKMIDDNLVQQMNDAFLNAGITVYGSDSQRLTRDGLIHSINKEITHTERIVLLNLLNKRFDVNYYSGEQPELLKDVTYCGTAHYFTEMPKIFKLSRINLNITLKSIQSGIPLRALDIMGSQGFLLSNYQPELTEYFTPGQDIVLYESIADAFEKAEYYLSHEDARQLIIKNASSVLKSDFNYPSRIVSMFKTAGIY